jgi:thiamine transporter
MRRTRASRRIGLLAETGILVAGALALSQWKIFALPSGGSVSLGGIPLLILAARRGAGVGCAAGCLTGMLLAALRPFVVHPVQFLLDYPLAYSCLGLAGLVSWRSPGRAAVATLLASGGKLACHVLAGVVFFSQPGLAWSTAMLGSLGYNLGHMLPETLLTTAAIAWMTTTHPALAARAPE